MRLGIDFDNTLGDLGGLLRRVTLERTGFDIRGIRERDPDVTDIEAAIHAALGRDYFTALVAEVIASDLSFEMEPRPGAIEVTRRLADRHEIVVVTARSERESAAPRRWLERHGLRVADFVATDYASKAPAAAEYGLALLLNDAVAVFEAFDPDHPTLPVLMAHAMNAGTPRPPHWRHVEDWPAFEALVRSLERERP